MVAPADHDRRPDRRPERRLSRRSQWSPTSIEAKIGLAATITQILVEGWSSSFDQDEALAERLLHEVLERDAHHPMARAQMGLLRRIQNRLSEAQAEVEMAICTRPQQRIGLEAAWPNTAIPRRPTGCNPSPGKGYPAKSREARTFGAFNGRWGNAICCLGTWMRRSSCSERRVRQVPRPIISI